MLLKDDGGNPEPEHEWPSENYWKRWYPHLFPDSSPESVHEQEQVSHHSPIFVKVYLLMLVRLSVFVQTVLFFCPSEIIKYAQEPLFISLHYGGFSSW